MELIDQPMRAKYMPPYAKKPIDCGPVRFEEDWYDEWLDAMIKVDEDYIFFLVMETTDVFEKEWNFNEAVYFGDNKEVSKRVNAAFNHGSHNEPMFIEPGVVVPPTTLHRQQNPGHSAGQLHDGSYYCVDCDWGG